MVAKVCKIQKVLNFAHFNQKNTHQCLQKCANIQNCYSNRAYMHDYCSFANDFFFLFFFCLSPFILLFSSVFFSQQNHKITPAQASTTDLYLLPTTKSQNHPCIASRPSTIDQGGSTTQIQKPKN